MNLNDIISHIKYGHPNPGLIIKTLLGMGVLGFIVLLFQFDAKQGPATQLWLMLVIFSWSSALILWQGRAWGKRPAQIALAFIYYLWNLHWKQFIFKFGLTGDVKSLTIFLMFLSFPFCVLIIATPVHFGFKYLERLSSESLQRQVKIRTTNVNLAEETDRKNLILHSPKYYSSLLPFGLLGNAVAPFLFITTLLMIDPFFQADNDVPITMFMMMLAFVLYRLSPFYNYVPSPFEKRRELIESFKGYYSTIFILQITGRVRILIYTDGMEIRVYYNRFFIPYRYLEKVEVQEFSNYSRLTLKCRLNGVPDTFRINVSSAEEIVATLERAMTRKKNTLASNKSTTKIEVKKATREKKINDTTMLKAVTAVLLLELSILLFTGTGIIMWKKIYLSLKSDQTEVHYNTYTSSEDWGLPRHWALVEVDRDRDGNVSQKKYYSWFGKIIIVKYVGKRTLLKRWDLRYYGIILFYQIGIMVFLIGAGKNENAWSGTALLLGTFFLSLIFLVWRSCYHTIW